MSTRAWHPGSRARARRKRRWGLEGRGGWDRGGSGGCRFPVLEVIVDGKKVFKKAPALALVGNIREYGTGFAILPDARPDDQLLDVCVMPCASPMDLIKLVLSAAAGEHVRQEGVVYLKGRQVGVGS